MTKVSGLRITWHFVCGSYKGLSNSLRSSTPTMRGRGRPFLLWWMCARARYGYCVRMLCLSCARAVWVIPAVNAGLISHVCTVELRILSRVMD